MGVTPLTLYAYNSPASNVATANKLISLGPGGAISSTTTKVGTGLGYGELYAQGNTNAWPNLSGVGLPSGNGWFFDVNTLDLQQLLVGNWQPSLRIRSSANTASIDEIVRAFLFDGVNYSQIGSNMVLLNQAITTASGALTFANTALPSANVLTGVRLYVDLWANVLSSTFGAGATLNVAQTSNPILGAAAWTIITPGFQPIPLSPSSGGGLARRGTQRNRRIA